MKANSPYVVPLGKTADPLLGEGFPQSDKEHVVNSRKLQFVNCWKPSGNND